eukprot:Nk52_evm85s270 gene=Nk52_evmTU85s270
MSDIAGSKKGSDAASTLSEIESICKDLKEYVAEDFPSPLEMFDQLNTPEGQNSETASQRANSLGSVSVEGSLYKPDGSVDSPSLSQTSEVRAPGSPSMGSQQSYPDNAPIGYSSYNQEQGAKGFVNHNNYGQWYNGMNSGYGNFAYGNSATPMQYPNANMQYIPQQYYANNNQMYGASPQQGYYNNNSHYFSNSGYQHLDSLPRLVTPGSQSASASSLNSEQCEGGFTPVIKINSDDGPTSVEDLKHLLDVNTQKSIDIKNPKSERQKKRAQGKSKSKSPRRFRDKILLQQERQNALENILTAEVEALTGKKSYHISSSSLGVPSDGSERSRSLSPKPVKMKKSPKSHNSKKKGVEEAIKHLQLVDDGALPPTKSRSSSNPSLRNSASMSELSFSSEENVNGEGFSSKIDLEETNDFDICGLLPSESPGEIVASMLK